MADIVIVPLTAPDCMGARALALLRSTDKLFLQTTEHPFSGVVIGMHRPFQSMDDLYQTAANFDELSAAIAARLVKDAPCVYAVTGHIQATQLPCIEAGAAAEGLSIEMLPGMPLHAAAYSDKPIGGLCTASELPHILDPCQPVVIEEIDSSSAASRVKLHLMEYFPDDWVVLLADVSKNGTFYRRQIPLFELDRQARYSPACCAYVPAAPPEFWFRSGYEQLMRVMRRLRAPGGCPWDREQTHESLKRPLLEECYELLDAIDEGDDEHLCEELGDVLLQVVFHCVIAEEQGRFTDRDVTAALVDKLIYRHPHIFAEARADTTEHVLANWEKLKKVEKGQQMQTDVLLSVPRNLPALTRSWKVQKKAANVGFDWPSAEDAFYKIKEETAELSAAMDNGGNADEELGDLLFAVVNVARLLSLDPEFLLRDATDKFIRRFSAMETAVNRDGQILENMTLSEMDVYWKEIKMAENGR